jgi:AcrR family transcriptional regulator
MYVYENNQGALNVAVKETKTGVVKKTKKSKVGRPRGSFKEDTLAKILPIARRFFAERGFAQTTFKDIGKELGITHAALYSYFPSKKELYLATLADTQTLLLPFYLKAIEEGATLRERIGGILMASAKAHDHDSTITGFLAAVPIELRRHQELNELIIGQNNDVMLALEGIFAEAKEKGEIHSDASPSNLLAAIFGGGVGVALFQYGLQGDNKPDSLTELMSVFVSMLDGTLFV